MLELRGNAIRKSMIEDLIRYKESKPGFTFYLIYNDLSPESVSYIKMIVKFLDALGIDHVECNVGTYEEALKIIVEHSDDECSIIIARPLLVDDEIKLFEKMKKEQDADMLSNANIGRLVKGDISCLPGTARSVIEILKHYDIKVKGKKALVIGRSISVGMPIFLGLQRLGAYCSLAHTSVAKEDIKASAKEADIIILAAGKRGIIEEGDYKKDAVIIDCGYHSDGKGDLGFVPDCYAYTPVPGGVGPLTIACVVDNGYRHYLGDHD